MLFQQTLLLEFLLALISLDDFVLCPVAGRLSGLNGSSAASPDGIHPYILGACSEALSLPLCLLGVRPLHEGVLPTL